jgi:hypothetical protein
MLPGLLKEGRRLAAHGRGASKLAADSYETTEFREGNDYAEWGSNLHSGALSFGLLACVANIAERRKCNTSAVALWLFAWSTLAMPGRLSTKEMVRRLLPDLR